MPRSLPHVARVSPTTGSAAVIAPAFDRHMWARAPSLGQTGRVQGRAAAYRVNEIVPREEDPAVDSSRSITTDGLTRRLIGSMHALGEQQSLCHIPKDELAVVRSLFQPGSEFARVECARLSQPYP
jgi:hypothetical protein